MRPTLPEEAWPLDRERWDSLVAGWKRVEDQFDSEPAEAVRQADRLFRDLTGQQEGSASSAVRVAMLLTRPPTVQRRLVYTGEGDFLSAISDFVRGLAETSRNVKRARAAARGTGAARDYRDASLDDLQEAMAMYRGFFERVLSVKRQDLDSLVPRTNTGAIGDQGPAGESHNNDPGALARDRAIAQGIVRESMRMSELAEARADRWRTFRWGVLGLMGNLAFGLVILLVVIWVLSQQ